ncbi:hypothetical protein B0H14DRAFT_3493783 [Mycena olivaceomarginata]|nr:hypothetical protein B0H14DRAFT_3493783 [Mycena olivaceomarginata]
MSCARLGGENARYERPISTSHSDPGASSSSHSGCQAKAKPKRTRRRPHRQHLRRRQLLRLHLLDISSKHRGPPRIQAGKQLARSSMIPISMEIFLMTADIRRIATKGPRKVQEGLEARQWHHRLIHTFLASTPRHRAHVRSLRITVLVWLRDRPHSGSSLRPRLHPTQHATTPGTQAPMGNALPSPPPLVTMPTQHATTLPNALRPPVTTPTQHAMTPPNANTLRPPATLPTQHAQQRHDAA